jgi:hypothetical protein
VRIAPSYTESDGYDATKILRIGGLILDPWQGDALDDWMARAPSGRWACGICGLSVPRQNGKTGLVNGRSSSGMIMYNERVVYTAHLQKTATETFEELAVFFDSPKLRKYIQDIKTALGREQIILKSGARIKFLARTRSGGRGQHGDLLIFDEAQELTSDQQASFQPAISASLNPQIIMLGTPPEPESDGTVFRETRDKALSGNTKKTAWMEFSVPEIGDVRDKRRWAETNPAMNRRILEDTIEAECESMSPDTFARERLGWWSPIIAEKEDHVIEEAAWNACCSREKKPEGKTAYGVKFSPDGSEVALCGAVCPEDGPARVSLINRQPTGIGIQWLADWLNARSTRASCVVIDGRNGVETLVEKIQGEWRYKGSIVCPRVRDVIAAVSTLTNEINEGSVTWYIGQEQLSHSAVSSVKRPVGGGFGFGGPDSAPIEAAALALWGCRTSKRDPTRKMRMG